VVVEGPKGTSKYVLLLALTVVCSQASHRTVNNRFRALATIQWLESWRQREDLKLVFNRRMRTRMSGGVGGVRSNAAPIPIDIVIRF
jgi:hypothetical protein